VQINNLSPCACIIYALCNQKTVIFCCVIVIIAFVGRFLAVAHRFVATRTRMRARQERPRHTISTSKTLLFHSVPKVPRPFIICFAPTVSLTTTDRRDFFFFGCIQDTTIALFSLSRFFFFFFFFFNSTQLILTFDSTLHLSPTFDQCLLTRLYYCTTLLNPTPAKVNIVYISIVSSFNHPKTRSATFSTRPAQQPRLYYTVLPPVWHVSALRSWPPRP
jgi:hypothetical protein